MGDRRPERRCRQTWLEAHYTDPQDAEAGDFPASCAKRSRCDWASTAGAGRAAAVLAALRSALSEANFGAGEERKLVSVVRSNIHVFLAKPLRVDDGAVKVVS